MNTPLKREDLIAKLQEGVAEVTFTKVDGSERVMRCTLKAELLPEPVDVVNEVAEISGRKPNPNIVPVYDLDVNGWRRFRVSSVQNINWE